MVTSQLGQHPGLCNLGDVNQVYSLDLGFSIYTVRLGTNIHHFLGCSRSDTG